MRPSFVVSKRTNPFHTFFLSEDGQLYRSMVGIELAAYSKLQNGGKFTLTGTVSSV